MIQTSKLRGICEFKLVVFWTQPDPIQPWNLGWVNVRLFESLV